MSKYVWVVILITISAALVPIFYQKSQKPETSEHTITLKIGQTELSAEIAEGEQEITQGLSGRGSLGENEGMYFVLGSHRVASFWMKEMRFPLDIIWIDEGKIVGIVENAPIPAGDNLPTYTSPTPVTHVLEVNAGFAKKYSIEAGQIVK